jgi:hypothetical protein
MPTSIEAKLGWGTNDELAGIAGLFVKITDAVVTACTIPLMQVTTEWQTPHGVYAEVEYYGMN